VCFGVYDHLEKATLVADVFDLVEDDSDYVLVEKWCMNSTKCETVYTRNAVPVLLNEER
jgi:hypothetical protein